MSLATWYEYKALPWFVDKALDNESTHKRREQVCAGLRGTVVEIGFGSGLNVGHYPPEVTEILAVEPARYGATIGADRIAAATVPIHFVGFDGERLPLEDESADAVLSTFTLCTIPDIEQAISEAWRVLRPGGVVHFLEHGIAESPDTQKWQHRLNPLQKKACGGCHITRHPAELLEAAGFDVTYERFTERPATHASMFIGTATKPSA